MTMSNVKKFAKACNDIDAQYVRDILTAKQNKCISTTKLLTKTLTDMITKESERIITEINDSILDGITENISSEIFSRLVQSIRNPLHGIGNADMEMGEDHSDTSDAPDASDTSDASDTD